MTQKVLAKEVGITERNLQNIEYGNSMPNVYLAKRIAKALNKMVEEVFSEEENEDKR